MSLLSKAGLLRRIAKGRKHRARLTISNLEKGLAFQIRATREKRSWTQANLAEAAGMGQSNIARLENPSYGKHTISSLKRVAEALDVALVVRLVPFSQYVDWLSGTPYVDDGLGPASMAVPSYDEEQQQGKFLHTVHFFGINHFIPVVRLPVDLVMHTAPQNSTGKAVSAFSNWYLTGTETTATVA